MRTQAPAASLRDAAKTPLLGMTVCLQAELFVRDKFHPAIRADCTYFL